MERCTYIEIAGRSYPMTFSLGATKRIVAKYGSTEKMKKALNAKGEEDKKLDLVTEMLELLISQGCAYKNYFEKDLPVPENAPIINGKWEPVPKEIIEIAIGITDVDEIVEKISECINTGNKKEVESKPGKKK